MQWLEVRQAASGPRVNWLDAAEAAKAAYKRRRCAGLSAEASQIVVQEIDALLAARLDAINKEEANLRKRYALSAQNAPQYVNFDVTYRTVKKGM